MGRTVAELEDSLSAAELSEWMAYQNIDPLPDPHWSAAQICTVIANCMSTRKFTISDFLPAASSARTSQRLSPERSRTMLRDMGVRASQ